MAITRAQVLDAALQILDEYGLADLSMRRLAAALGVQPGALYWHVANKQTLLIALADRIVADLVAPSWPPASDRRVVADGLVAWAMELREALLAHRNGAELFSAAVALRPESDAPWAAVEASLVAAGRARDEAVVLARGIVHLVVGAVLDLEQRRAAADLGLVSSPDGQLAAERLRDGLARLVDAS